MADQIPPGTDLSQIPAGTPPPGQVSNLEHPNGSLEPAILGVGTVMMVISVVSVATATVHRLRTLKKLSLADWMRLAGLVFTIAFTAVCFALSYSALHTWDIRLSVYNNPAHAKLNYVETTLLGPTICFSKLAILLLYLEIFKVNRTLRWLIYFGMAFNVVIYWILVFVDAYYCAPHGDQTWGISLSASCGASTIWAPIQGSLATVLDIYIFILPLPGVWSLKMSRRQKMGVTAVFGTAVLGILACVIALVYRFRLYLSLHAKYSDLNWLQYEVLICVMVENGVALLVSSMPAAAAQAKDLVHGYEKMRSYMSRNRTGSSASQIALPQHHRGSGILRADSYDVQFYTVGPQEGEKRSTGGAAHARRFEDEYA